MTHAPPRLLALVTTALACAPDCPEPSDLPAWTSSDVDEQQVESSDLRREPLYEAAERRVVFRYRAWDGERPPHVSSGTTSLVHAEQGDVLRFVRGDGLDDALVAAFDGVAHDYVADVALPPLQDGFTVGAWFRSDGADGTVLSTDPGDGGVRIEIAGGALKGGWSVQDSTGAVVSYEIVDPDPLPEGWSSVALRVAPAGSDLQARLYRDETLVAEETLPAGSGLVVGAPPVVGAAPDGTARFAGEIEAVEVRSWPVDHDILATAQVRDGGCGLGRLCYLDPVSDSEDILDRLEQADRRYVDNALARVRLAAPFLNDHYTPQGLEIGEDGRTLYLSAYWSKALENPDRHPSVVIEIDLAQRRATRLFQLRDGGSAITSHVGGVGVLGRKLYVPSRNTVRLFDLDAGVQVSAADERGTPEILTLEVEERFDTANQGSFLEIDAEAGALWVGQFVYVDNPVTGYLDRYDLDAEGRIARPCTETSDERVELPVLEIQGAWPRMKDGELEVLLASSFYDRPSQIYRWTPGEPAVEFACLPAGLEELDVGPDGTVWTWFESAGRNYQTEDVSAPWSDVYPYILGMEL